MNERAAPGSTPRAERLAERLEGLSAGRRALLERWMEERGLPLARLPIVRVDRRRGPFPVSFAQRRLWFADQLRPGDPAFNVPTAVRVRGDLDLAALDRAVASAVDRHEALRTAFAAPDGEPVQAVRPAGAWRSPRVDLGALPPARREAEAERTVRREVRRPFALAEGPLLRTLVVRLGDGDHVVALTVHHIATDDWSMSLLARDLAALYRAHRRGRPPELPPAPEIQYLDYAVWQRRHLDRRRVRRELDYWTRALAGAPAEPPVRAEKPRPGSPSTDGGAVAFVLERDAAEALRRLGRERGGTLYAPLLAGYVLILSWLSGRRDVVVGTPVVNRDRSELEGVVGLFFNLLVLRTRFDGARTFGELVGAAAETVAGAFAHQELPFELLVESLRPERGGAETPLYAVTFTLHNAPWANPSLDRLDSEPFAVDGGTVRADLQLDVVEGPERLHGRLSYRRELVAEARAGRLVEHLARTYRRAAAGPEVELAELYRALDGAETELLAEASRRVRASRGERLRSLRRRPGREPSPERAAGGEP